MHELVPSEVAMAVRTVMAKCSIFGSADISGWQVYVKSRIKCTFAL